MRPPLYKLMIILLLALGSALPAACGKKGPLYLPDQQQTSK